MHHRLVHGDFLYGCLQITNVWMLTNNQCLFLILEKHFLIVLAAYYGVIATNRAVVLLRSYSLIIAREFEKMERCFSLH